MAVQMIAQGAAIDEGNPDHLIVFISGYSRDQNSVFHFSGYAEQFSQTKLFLRDGTNTQYENGVSGISDDDEGTLEFLRYVIRKLGAKRVSFVSGSVGTHPTLRWACELGVDDVYLLGPVTEFLSALESPRAAQGAFAEIRAYVETLVARDYKYINVRTLLEEKGDKIGAIDLFYGLDDPTDIQQAKIISDLPNVRSTVYHRGDHMRVPMFVQRRDTDLADRLNSPVEKPGDVRASGQTAPIELGYAQVVYD